MRVVIPPPLHSYTGGVSRVELSGGTLAELLEALEARFAGIRFRVVDEQDRIRPHIRLFVGGHAARSLSEPLGADEEIRIVCALSGG